MKTTATNFAKSLKVAFGVAITVVTAVALQVSPVNPFAEPEPAFAAAACPDRVITYPNNPSNLPGYRYNPPYGLVAASGGGYELPSAGATVEPGTLGCTSEWRADTPNNKDGYLVFDYGANVFDAGGDTITLTFDLYIYRAFGVVMRALDLTSGTALPVTAGVEEVLPLRNMGHGNSDVFKDNASYSGSPPNRVVTVWTPNPTQKANLLAGGKLAILIVDMAQWAHDPPFTVGYDIMSNVVLSDYSTVVNYTVTFDPNLGMGTMSSQRASAAANLTANTFTRDGYRFTGWNTDALGTGTSYSDSASYPFTASATLFAQWVSDVTVASISQASGSSAGGTSITITGTNFASGVAVTIGGVPCESVTFVSSTSITCVTPAGLPGTSADVTVTNSDSGTATLSSAYDYVFVPLPSENPLTTFASLVNTGLNSWNSILGALAAGSLIIIAFGAFSARSQLKFAGSRAKLLSILRRAGLGD